MNLTKESLEQTIVEIKNWTKEREKLIALKPTKLLMFRYPHETEGEFKQRCEDAKTITNSMLEERNNAN